MNFIKKNIRWIALGGCGFALLSVFLAFYKYTTNFLGIVSVTTESYIKVSPYGILVLFAIIGAGVLIFLKKELWALAPISGAVAIVIFNAISPVSVANELEQYGLGDIVKPGLGIGFYLILVGLAVAGGIFCYSEFVLKKQGMGFNVQGYSQQNYNQGYQPYNYNQPVPTMVQQGYGQPFVGGQVNNMQQPIGMPTNNDMYNRASVAQGPVQQMVQVQPVMGVQQPAMNNMQQQPFQNFANPVAFNCPQCGSVLNPGTSFCHQCGSKVN